MEDLKKTAGEENDRGRKLLAKDRENGQSLCAYEKKLRLKPTKGIHALETSKKNLLFMNVIS